MKHVDKAIHKSHHSGILSKWIDGWRIRKVAQHIRPHSRVLDIGCGPAWFAQIKPLKQYVGVDQDPHLMAENQKKFPHHSFFSADLTGKLPDFGTPFDLIIAAAFIEHLNDLRPLLSQLYSRLMPPPSGKLLITTPSPLGGQIHKLMAYTGLLSLQAARDHKHFWTDAELANILNRTGFIIDHFEKFQLGFNRLIIAKKDDCQPLIKPV